VLGRALTSDESARVGAILDKASEDFRRRSGQKFTAGSSVVRLKVDGGRVYLTQRPVVSVASVVDDDAVAVTYTRSGQWLTVDDTLTSSDFVTVNYSHGGTVPDDVRLCIAELAARCLQIDTRARTGQTQFQQTEGPFSEGGTFAAWAVGGQTMLSPADLALADYYKVAVPTLRVMLP
jgi:hypothetical protein